MIWLIGAGPMSIEYFKVLRALGRNVVVIGRSEHSTANFKRKSGFDAFSGGVEKFLEQKPILPDAAIVSVSVEQLADVAMQLIYYGVTRILLEKPGGLNSSEIQSVHEISERYKCEIFIAYNRRHYSSVRMAQRLIEEDGGVRSFSFEITEWSHLIKNHNKDPRVLSSWFLGNTTHIIDTAFFLGGKPKEIKVYSRGGIHWHLASSIYAGAGVSDTGALFSYHGNWQAPGRWSLDIFTNKRRYIFCPMEQLHVQEIGETKSIRVYLDDSNIDTEFKPGLYKQVSLFLQGDCERFCNIKAQLEMSKLYEKMAGY